MDDLSLTGNHGCGLNQPLGLSRDHNKCRKLDQRSTFPMSCMAAMIIGFSTVGFSFCINSICLICFNEF